MAPVATAGFVFVAALLVTAVMVGILAGTITWAVRLRLLWGGLLAGSVFLAVTVVLGSYRLEPAAAHGLPLVLATYLACWLTAYFLEMRARWRHLWATLAGFGCAVLVGALSLSLMGRYLGLASR